MAIQNIENEMVCDTWGHSTSVTCHVSYWALDIWRPGWGDPVGILSRFLA